MGKFINAIVLGMALALGKESGWDIQKPVAIKTRSLGKAKSSKRISITGMYKPKIPKTPEDIKAIDKAQDRRERRGYRKRAEWWYCLSNNNCLCRDKVAKALYE